MKYWRLGILIIFFLFIEEISAQKNKQQETLDSRVSEKIDKAMEFVTSKLDSQLVSLSGKIDKSIETLDKKKLEVELTIANKKVSEKESLIEYYNCLINWFTGIFATIFAIMGLILGYITIGPINTQKKELKKLIEKTNEQNKNYEALITEAKSQSQKSSEIQKEMEENNKKITELEANSKKINEQTKELKEDAKSLLKESKDLNKESIGIRGETILQKAEIVALNKEANDITSKVKETNSEANKSLEKATLILHNIEGTLKDVVEKKYEAYENEQFYKAIELLKRNETCRSVAIPLLHNLCATKLPKEWAESLLNFLKTTIDNIEPGFSMEKNQDNVAEVIAQIFTKHEEDALYEDYIRYLIENKSTINSEYLLYYLRDTSIYFRSKLTPEKIDLFFDIVRSGIEVYSNDEDKAYSAASFLIVNILVYSKSHNVILHDFLLKSDEIIEIISKNNLSKEIHNFAVILNYTHDEIFDKMGLSDENSPLRKLLEPKNKLF